MKKSENSNFSDIKKEFDDLVKRMQSKTSQRGVAAISTATTADLAKAARRYRLNEEASFRVQRAQKIVRKYHKAGDRSAVDELIEERHKDQENK